LLTETNILFGINFITTTMGGSHRYVRVARLGSSSELEQSVPTYIAWIPMVRPLQ